MFEIYSNSTKYGAELKEALRATLMVGLASTPRCVHELNKSAPRNELSARIALQVVRSSGEAPS